MVDIAYL